MLQLNSVKLSQEEGSRYVNQNLASVSLFTFWEALYTLQVMMMFFLVDGHNFPHSAAAAKPLLLQIMNIM